MSNSNVVKCHSVLTVCKLCKFFVAFNEVPKFNIKIISAINMEQNSKKFASMEQKLRLVHLVEADPQLKSGKFSSTFTKNEAKRRWLMISEELNAITGAKKTWEEWRKTWQDRKANAKKKFASLRRQANLTGGGPPPDPPTVEESIIINSFDQQSLVGHTDSQESAVSFIDLSQPGKSDESITPKVDLPYPGNYDDRAEIDLSQPGIQTIGTVDVSQSENIGDVSRIDLPYPGNYDGRAEIDLSQPGVETIGGTVNLSRSEKIGNLSRIATLSKSSIPKATGTKQRRTVAQRRLQEGLNAAQRLNKSLEEKNQVKKKFYEEFIKLMAIQTQALVDIATALKNNMQK